MRTDDKDALRACRGIEWAAGLFEGEGCITTHGREGYLKLTLKMTDEDVVREFAHIMGVGPVYGPYSNKGNRQDYWEWTTVNRQAQLALNQLRPYLMSRREARAKELAYA